MKKNILMIFLTTIFWFYSFSTVLAQETVSELENTKQTLELGADAAILMDATTGEILYEKNSDKKEYPASITKIMTALLALESGKMDETITFSHNAIFGIEPGSSHIALQEGEKITMEQALYALLMRSANEAALGIAEQVDGSVEAFSNHMTQRAKELGCENTNFVNPNGLHDENHYTTAYDMALIAKEALKFDEFRKIIQTMYYEIPPTNKQSETRYLYGQHQMIKPPSIYTYEGCEGGKTGFTNEAQNTLVTYAKRDNTELIAVVLHCQGAGHYEDTIKLFDYGFANYKTQKLSSADDIAKTISVVKQEGEKISQIDSITAKPETDIYKTVPIDFDSSQLTTIIDVPQQLTAAVNKNDEVGNVKFYYQGKILSTIPLLADRSSEDTTAVAASIQTNGTINTMEKNMIPFFGNIRNMILFSVGCGIVTFFIAFLICRTISCYKRRRRRLARQKRLSRHRRSYR